MQNNTKNVCRCCLKLVHSTNVVFVNVVMRKMFSFLLIKLDLDVSEHPLVCGTCFKVLDDIYLFKSKCLETEDIISAHIETNSKVALRDILIEMENKRNIHIGEDEMVCRLCIKIPLNGSYIALGETGDGISLVRDIQIHLPEMDMSIDEKPIICEVCHVQLKNYASFATNCMAMEEKIKLYCDIKKISGPVDLAHVLQFMEDKAVDLQNSLDKDLIIKQEDDSVIVKVEKVQDADNLMSEDRLVHSSSPSELYLKNEEIEIKSENDDMREEMGDSVPLGVRNNSMKSGSLKTKRDIRKSEDKPEVEAHKCQNGEYETRHKRNIKEHIKVKHPDPSAERKFRCDKCSYETNVKRNLRKHNLVHRDKSEVKMHMVKHRDPKAEKKFKCDKCSYETDLNYALCRHNLIHKDRSEVKMHKCANCEYETKRKRNLISHMVRHCDPKAEQKFKCDKCSYETDLNYALRRHNLIHKDRSEVKMHKCENCEYETRHKRYLKQHNKVKHRDPKTERKFKCDKCSYETDSNSYLRKHNLIHKDKSEVMMHKCENCEYETRFKGNMKHHMVKHRDPKAERKFKCAKCSYETNDKRNLRSHNLIHKDKSEVMMYECENCEYATKRKGNLSTHMLKHRHPLPKRR